jgi:hypothetical protein
MQSIAVPMNRNYRPYTQAVFFHPIRATALVLKRGELAPLTAATLPADHRTAKKNVSYSKMKADGDRLLSRGGCRLIPCP